MSFFVVERGAADGSLRVPVPRAFETREAALEALSSAIAAGESVIDGEVFVVDLGAAVPVLLMPTPAPAPVVAAAEPGAEPATPGVVDGAPIYDAWAEAVVSTEESADEDLAVALKRAATSLEAEGIVAPASIDAVAAGDVTEWSTGAPSSIAEPAGESGALEGDTHHIAEPPVPGDSDAMADLSAALEGLGSAELPGGVDVAGQPLSDDGAVPGDSWPWTNVTPVAGSQAAVADDEAPRDLIAETVASLDEDSAVDVSMLTPVAEGDAAYMPRPVILGDYDDAPASDIADQLEALADSEADGLEYMPQPTAVVPEDADDASVTPVEAPVGAWLAPSQAPDKAETGTSEGSAPGYEGGADLDLGTYTCDDCVYSNTCPKVGQATPADCGSFQWRSE
jgi:hypothetical protein